MIGNVSSVIPSVFFFWSFCGAKIYACDAGEGRMGIGDRIWCKHKCWSMKFATSVALSCLLASDDILDGLCVVACILIY